MLAGRVLVTMTVVGGSGLFAGAEFAGAEFAGAELGGAELGGAELAGDKIAGALAWPPWLDGDIGTGVCFSVLLLLAITGFSAELDGGTVTV